MWMPLPIDETTTLGEARALLAAAGADHADNAVRDFVAAYAADGRFSLDEFNDDSLRVVDVALASPGGQCHVQLLDTLRPGARKRVASDDAGEAPKRQKTLTDAEATAGIPTTDIACYGGCSFNGGTSGYCSSCWRRLSVEQRMAASRAQLAAQADREAARAGDIAQQARKAAVDRAASESYWAAERAAAADAAARNAAGSCHRLFPLELVPDTTDWTHWIAGGERLTSGAWEVWTCGVWDRESHAAVDHDSHSSGSAAVATRSALAAALASQPAVYLDSMFSQPWLPLVLTPELLNQAGVESSTMAVLPALALALGASPSHFASLSMLHLSWPASDHELALVGLGEDPEYETEDVAAYQAMVQGVLAASLPGTACLVAAEVPAAAGGCVHLPSFLVGLVELDGGIGLGGFFSNHTTN